MTTIAEGAEILRKAKEAGTIKPASTGTTPTAYPTPTSDPQLNPLLRGPMPAGSVLTPDTARQWHNTTLPQTRILPAQPLQSANNPVAGAQAQSQAIVQIAATPPVTSGGGSGTDVDIITGLNTQSFGGFDAAFQKSTNLSTTGFTFNVTTQGANEQAILMGDSHIGFGGHVVDNPGGWTAGFQAYLKVLPTAGAQVIPATYGGGFVRPAVAGLALFKTNGSTPVFTGHGSQSGGQTLTSLAFTPAAGNSLMVMVDTSGNGTNADLIHVSDTAGNLWVKVFDAFGSYFDTGAGLNYSSQVTLFYCQNPANVSTVMTATVLPLVSGGVGGFGTISFAEVSNLSNVSSGSYTFQTSDNLKLVQFRGGANITATLPNPALAANWQAIVSNSNFGTTTITPASGVLLNGTTSPVILPPGGSTWVWSDGTNYFASTTVLPSALQKQANQWLDSFDPTTGLYTQSQPAFSNLSGNIAVAQVNSGTGASSTTFFRGDNTWAVPPTPPTPGGVNPQSSNYTLVTGDNGKLVPFNTTTGFAQGAKSDYSSRASIALAFAANNAAGNMIVVFASNAGTNIAGVTISDTRLNTYNQLFTDTTINGFVQIGWYALNIGAGANTVTASWTGAQSSGLIIEEWFGIATVGALDQSGKTTGSGNWASSSLTTTTANQALVAWVSNASDSLTTTSPFTQRQTILFSGSVYAQMADSFAGPTGIYQATGTGGGAYVAFLATFKTSGTGGTLTATLPASPPSSTWSTYLQNFGVGTLSVNPNGKLLDIGSANVTVAAGKGIGIFTDGSNYYSFRGGS